MGTKYVLSLSGGKDSMATLILAKRHNEPLDAAVWARVMWDETRGAEHPEHDAWMMDEAIPKIEREWGVPVHVLESRKNVKAEMARTLIKGKHVGMLQGWPPPGMCWVAGACKMSTLKQVKHLYPGEEIIQYIGIAADEPKRLARLKSGCTSLLAKYECTEQMAAEMCREQGLLSPMYEFTKRGGCFFCTNSSDEQLRHLRQNHPDLWAEMLELDAVANRVRTKFTRRETLREIDKRLSEEVRGWEDA